MSLSVKSFSNGEVIIKEGDSGKSIFRLVEGNADVYSDFETKDPFRLAVLKAGDYFGEMAIFQEYTRSATVVARGNVRVLEIAENELNEFMSENPDVIGELVNHLGTKVQNMINDFNEAKVLLKNLREADAAKKKSLFSKIKKHIDIYQSNKNGLTDPNPDAIRETYADITYDDSDRIESYDKGTAIFNEGESGNCMYILHGGIVNLYNGYGSDAQQQIADLEAVSVFGEMEMIFEGARTTTAVAASDSVTVEKIYMEDLESIFRTNPAKITMLLRHLSYRLRTLNVDFLNICKEITENYND